jgi:WD40 repeat protein
MKTAQVARRRLIHMMVLLALALLSLTACGLLPFASSPTTITQGQGLPTLRHLDWGFAAIHHPVWSPDGRWIAVLAGYDYAGAHVEVVSPDGHTRHDLSNWGCGEGPEPDYAWLPDGRLSCITRETPYPRLCIGAAPFGSCVAVRLSQEIIGDQQGLAWTPDGRLALYAARSNDGITFDAGLYLLTSVGEIQQMLSVSGEGDVADPSFRPHASELAYYRGASVSASGLVHFDLVVSSFAQDAAGKLALGPARTIATEQDPDMSLYAWSPSGRWLAVRYSNYRGGDRIYLVNPDDPEDPTQALDVVHAELAQQQMTDPIWSPDGKTLIVFGVNDEQPYAIDIASYLTSKGLQS